MEFGVLIVLAALAIPFTAVVVNGVQKVAKMRLEEARLRAGGSDGSTANELTALRDEVAHMRQEIDELHERTDFTERMLAQTRDRMRLPQSDGGLMGRSRSGGGRFEIRSFH